MNEKFPFDIKHILEESGFDTELSLLAINNEIIADIERHVNNNREILKETSYQNVLTFKFKPGHKAFIVQLPSLIEHLRDSNPEEVIKFSEKTEFSLILRTFIQTAESNGGKHPKAYRYNETNRYFSTFIYLLCGKACYETLSANLPIPTSNTIRKTISKFFLNFWLH